MALNLDGDALRKGVAVAAAVSIPIGVLAWLVLDDDPDVEQPWWVGVFSLAVLVALGVGAFVAARDQRQGTPLMHGIVAAAVVFSALELLRVVRLTVRDADLEWSTVLSNAMLTLLAGIVGGVVGGRANARRRRAQGGTT